MSAIIELIHATVRVEQPLGNGQSTVGTGFLVTSTSSDGAPRTVLITAKHVFERMPHELATIGFRVQDPSGAWEYAPVNVRIRQADGRPSWTSHPTQDVAAIELLRVSPPSLPAKALPGEHALEALGVHPGDEMMVLGFPRGFSANRQGFPILSSGRVASYPLSPAHKYPTYLVNMNVHAGNSGGPVYTVLPSAEARPSPEVVVTGLLTQQIKVNGERLAIGNVTQADFISETISLLDSEGGADVVASPRARKFLTPAAQGPQPGSNKTDGWWPSMKEDVRIFFARCWIWLRDKVNGWLTRDPLT